MKQKKIRNESGITGTDVVISIVIIVLFTGIIGNMMINSYKLAVDIKKDAVLDAYATIILEKVDEKPYESIESDFIDNLISSGEVDFGDLSNENYKFEVVEDYNNFNNTFKKVDLTLNYKGKEFKISKLKVKEILQ